MPAASILERVGLLDAAQEYAFDRITRIACRLTGASTAIISLNDGERLFFKSVQGEMRQWAEWRELPVKRSLFQFVTPDGPLVVPDTSARPEMADTVSVQELGIAAFLGAPLLLKSGVCIGALAVVDGAPRTWTEQDIVLMTDLAALVVTEIALRIELRERTAAQQEQRRKDELLRLIINNIPGMVSYVDRTQHYQFVNRAYAAWFGWEPEDLIGKSVRQVLGEELYAVARPAVDRTLRGETVSFENATTRRSDGRHIALHATYAPHLGPNGEVYGYFSMIADVTAQRVAAEALRRSEQHLRNVIDNLHSFVGVLTPDGLLIEANRTALEWAGLHPEDVLQRPFADAYWWSYSPDVQAQVRVAIERAAAGKPSRYDTALRLAEDRFMEIDFTIAPIFDEQGNVTYLIPSGFDISERKRAEEALLDREARLSTMFKQTSMGLALISLEGRVVQMNQAMASMLDYDPAEALSITVEDYTYPGDLHRQAELMQQLVAGDVDHFTLEKRYVRRGGDIVWGQLSMSLVRDAETGAPEYFVAAVQDITERKQARERLDLLVETNTVLSESLDYTKTLQRVADLVVPRLADWCAVDLVTPDDRIEAVAIAHVDPAKVEWARELRRQNPVDMDAPAGVPAVLRTGRAEFYPVITDEMLRQAIDDPERLVLAQRVGYHSIIIVPLRTRDQVLGALTLVWAESGNHYSEADVDLARELGLRFATAIDNSRLYDEARSAERRLSELLAMFETLLANAPVGFGFFDSAERMLRVNETLARLGGLGASSAGHTLSEVQPALAAQVMPQVRQVFSSGQPVHNVEMSLARGDSSETLHCLVSWYPVGVERGEPRFVGMMMVDISDRKHYEESLKNFAETLEQAVVERTAELERSNRELDQFAYVASHDLRAPLRAIDNLSLWIEEDAAAVLPEQSVGHLQKLRGRVMRMERLLDDLLAFSRAGRYTYQPSAIDTGALVRDVVDVLNVPPGFAVTVEGDQPTIFSVRTPLETVLRNLIDNAIKHHNRADGYVRVTINDLGDSAEFVVEDNGPGIDPAYHTRIFELFQTLNPRDKVEGSGMGLAIVKKTIESMGGQISVASAEGEGACFRFTWPSQSRPG